MPTNVNLGRIKGAGFFTSTASSSTSVAISTIAPTNITPLVGDSIVFPNGDVRRVTAKSSTTITCGAVVANIRGAVGAGSNPNLLINSNFAINQRGKASYNTTGYTVDQWMLGFDGNKELVPLDGGGAKVIIVTQGTYTNIEQRIELIPAGIYTFTVNTSDTSKYNFPYCRKNGTNNYFTITQISSTTTQAVFNVNITETTAINIGVQVKETAGEVIINWVKLEVGSVATEYTPPNRALELAKCQRYLYIFKDGVGVGQSSSNSNQTAIIRATLPVPMRTIPTVNLSIGTAANAGMQVRAYSAGAQTTVSAITGISIATGNTQIEFKVGLNAGITTGAVVDSWLYDTKIYCSAEL